MITVTITFLWVLKNMQSHPFKSVALILNIVSAWFPHITKGLNAIYQIGELLTNAISHCGRYFESKKIWIKTTSEKINYSSLWRGFMYSSVLLMIQINNVLKAICLWKVWKKLIQKWTLATRNLIFIGLNSGETWIIWDRIQILRNRVFKYLAFALLSMIATA